MQVGEGQKEKEGENPKQAPCLPTLRNQTMGNIWCYFSKFSLILSIFLLILEFSPNYKKILFYNRSITGMLSILNSFCSNVFTKRSLTPWGMERGDCYTKVLLLIENVELKHLTHKTHSSTLHLLRVPIQNVRPINRLTHVQTGISKGLVRGDLNEKSYYGVNSAYLVKQIPSVYKGIS